MSAHAAGARVPPTGSQFLLEGEGQRAVVTEVGATLRSWRVGEREQLDTFPVDELDDDYRGKVLVPWPNRIRDARYVFRGTEYRTAISEPERGGALHGLVLWASWRPLRHSRDEVALGYMLHPQPGYPFTLELEVAYRLVAGGLEVTLSATNRGAEPAPFGAGFHPYLKLGDALPARCPRAPASRSTSGCCRPARRCRSRAPSTTSAARARSGSLRSTPASAISSATPTGWRARRSWPATAR